jgi:hypothetical protein
LPDFVIVGAQKAGTSSLYSYLAQHPQVLAATRKEIHYFDAPAYEGGPGWYRAHFPMKAALEYLRATRGQTVLTGEASPYYLAHPHSAARMHALVPRAKLIVMFRNPVDRALSHYEHQKRKKREPLCFEEALGAEPARLAGEYQKMLTNPRYYSHDYWAYSYIARGMYWQQLDRWFSVYSRSQFLFISSERFFADPRSVYQQTQAFLGLEPFDLGDYGKRNSGGSYEGLGPNTRQLLAQHFQRHNERLYEQVGYDFGWNNANASP